MRPSIRLGRLHGIPVGLHWSALAVLGLLTAVLAATLPRAAGGYAPAAYWLAGLGFSGLFLLALLAHEYAHARVAQRHGIPVKSITLWMLGGFSELESEPQDARTDLRIALAGPVASLVVAAAFFGLAVPARLVGAPLLAAGFAWLGGVNGILAVFNALPAAPLDGGRALAAIVWRVRGDRDAGRRAAAGAGVTLGLVLVGLGMLLALATRDFAGIWLAMVGWYLALTARAQGSYLRLTGDLGRVPVGRLMSAPAVCGYAGETVTGFAARVASAQPHHCYPVVGLDGGLAGLVLTSALAAVPEARRSEVRLADLLVPAGRVRTAQRDTPVGDPSALPAAPLRLVVVLDGSRPCGVLTAGDLERALAVARIGAAPDRSPRCPDDLFTGR